MIMQMPEYVKLRFVVATTSSLWRKQAVLSLMESHKESVIEVVINVKVRARCSSECFDSQLQLSARLVTPVSENTPSAVTAVCRVSSEICFSHSFVEGLFVLRGYSGSRQDLRLSIHCAL